VTQITGKPLPPCQLAPLVGLRQKIASGPRSNTGRLMRVSTATVVLLAVLAGSVQPLTAQESLRSKGLWIAGGLGGGWTRVHCDICSSDLLLGLSATLGVGSRLSSSLTLGLEGSGWRKRVESSAATTKRRLAALQGVVYWYPARNGPRYFFKGALGIVTYRVDDDPGPDEEDEEPITSNSIGGQVGVGYEIPISNNLSFVPYVNFLGSLGADLTRGSTELTTASVTAIQFGLGLTWH
jgi:hypothetical protein